MAGDLAVGEPGSRQGRRRPRETRPHRVQVRLSDLELEALEERAAGAGVSLPRLLVEAALVEPGASLMQMCGAPRRPRDLAALEDAVRALARVGSNVNQLARAANTGEAVGLGELADAVRAAVATVEAAADRLARA